MAKIVGKRDISMGEEMGYKDPVIRIAYDVEIGDGDKASLLDVAKGVVSDLDQPVNALTVFFWKPGQYVGKEVSFANIDYAPHGKWELADTVKAGDYSTHEYLLNWEIV